MLKKFVSSILLLLTLMSLVLCVHAAEIVDSGECGAQGDNVIWTLDSEGTLTISGEGDMLSNNPASSSNIPWRNYSGRIKSAIIEKGVTSICSFAFYNCNNLITVSIPASVTDISDSAFDGNCAVLQAINVNADNRKYCSDNGVLFRFNNSGTYRIIMKYPMNKSETIYTIPSDIGSIDSNAFSKCKNLQRIYVDNNNQEYSSIDGVIFNKNKTMLLIYPAGNTQQEYEIPDGVVSITSRAFYCCENLRNIVISEGVERIGGMNGRTFEGCISLKSMTIPVSLKSVTSWLFEGCYNLQDIYYNGSLEQWNNLNLSKDTTILNNKTTIHCTDKNSGILWDVDDEGTLTISGEGDMPDYAEEAPWSSEKDSIKKVVIEQGITNISDYLFYNYDKLKSVMIPESVNNIGLDAFLLCTGLTEITVDSANKNYSSENGVLFNKDKTELILYPIGNSRTSYAIPDTVQIISKESFYYAKNLTSVTIPNSVTKIGDCAFFGCINLTSLVIPASVSNIGYYAYGVFEYGDYFSGKGYECYPATVYGEEGSAAQSYVENLNADRYSDLVSFVSYLIEDRGAILTGCDSYNNGREGIGIPKEIEGYPITMISENTFLACDKLKNVYYCGSEENWVNIIIESGNDYLEIANKSYNCAMPFFLRNYEDFLYRITQNGIVILKCPSNSEMLSIPSQIDGIPVISLGDENFYAPIDDNVKSIMIPNNISSVYSYIFHYCNGLHIIFRGTEVRWENINTNVNDIGIVTYHFRESSVGEGAALPQIGDLTLDSSVIGGIVDLIKVSLIDTEYDSTMITAFYKDGAMVDMQTTPVKSGDEMKDIPIPENSGADSAKVFIWSSLGSMKPLCEAKEIDINL